MKRTLLVMLMLLSGMARAAVDTCEGQPDGVPCSTACRMGGTCEAGLCAGAKQVPAGTRCASGDLCSMGDACDDAGECVPGPQQLSCDDGDDCTADRCDAERGCVSQTICLVRPIPGHGGGGGGDEEGTDGIDRHDETNPDPLTTASDEIPAYYAGGAGCSVGHRASPGHATAALLLLGAALILRALGQASKQTRRSAP
jgi:hypothetical protein